MPAEPSIIVAGEHPDHPGWNEWRISDPSRFNGSVLGLVLVRPEAAGHARVRMFPKHHLTNVNDGVHGGVILALADVSLFAGSALILGKELSRGSTIELNTHFVGAADPALPLDSVLEVVKETGRMVFLRGTVVQDDNVISSFSGIIRKPSAR
jgi:acyl-coenzyme A thioesterase PaaI-like protein